MKLNPCLQPAKNVHCMKYPDQILSEQTISFEIFFRLARFFFLEIISRTFIVAFSSYRSSFIVCSGRVAINRVASAWMTSRKLFRATQKAAYASDSNSVPILNEPVWTPIGGSSSRNFVCHPKRRSVPWSHRSNVAPISV